MGIGKIDPEYAIREGWARDSDDEIYMDGYNAFIQVTTRDGTSGFQVKNDIGAVSFSSKSDGDGYVSKNLGVGTYFPTAELEVIGKTKTEEFQMATGAQSGYVLTSDENGVGTWEDAYAAGGGISETEHRDLDQLVHLVSENSFDEFFYTNFRRISKIITWTDQSKVKKIREHLISYAGVKTAQVITIQYNSSGTEVERATENINYQNFNISNIVRTLT